MDEFVATWISSSPRVCRNATMSTDADAVLALAVGDPEILLADVRELGETETLQYARSWLTLVAEELRTELQLALALAPRTTTTATEGTTAPSRTPSSPA